MNVDQAITMLYKGLRIDMLELEHPSIPSMIEEFETQINVADGSLLFQLYCRYLFPYHGRWAHSVIKLRDELRLLWKRDAAGATDSVIAFLRKHGTAIDTLLNSDPFMSALHENLMLLYEVHREFTGIATS
jgi:hypothetical protein